MNKQTNFTEMFLQRYDWTAKKKCPKKAANVSIFFKWIWAAVCRDSTASLFTSPCVQEMLIALHQEATHVHKKLYLQDYTVLLFTDRPPNLNETGQESFTHCLTSLERDLQNLFLSKAIFYSICSCYWSWRKQFSRTI